MNEKKANNQGPTQDRPILTSFLHELTIARKQLALYPVDHPNIKTSINKTIDILNQLFHLSETITLGITPEALLFEQLWLDRDDQANRDFAHFFSTLGIASISFHNGLQGPELIRFNQLLRADRSTIESFGGFEALLQQQQIDHVSIIPIDYEAFQSSRRKEQRQEQLWETFLHGLQNGILDFGDGAADFDLNAVAELLERQFSEDYMTEHYGSSFEKFIENRIQEEGFAHTYTETDRKFNSLLRKLRPEAQEQIFTSIFRVLDRNQEAAPSLLKKVPAQLLQGALARKSQQQSKISSRLLALATSLVDEERNSHKRTVKSGSAPLSPDMVRARLDVLFSEEKQDLYMPGNYQAALGEMLGDHIQGSIPEEEKEKLKAQLKEQPVESNFVAILLEMLQRKLNTEQENAVQQNLLDQSRYFLDIGNFEQLLDIYQSWSDYLYSGNAGINVFEEKVLAIHTQASFMAEVIDAFELWDEDRHPQIVTYIVTVGDPYSDLVIEQLGLAPTWEQRKQWMEILERIGGDAQQKILRALDDDRWYLVRNLLSVLNKQLAPKSGRIVQQLCSHQHPKVRAEAIKVLFTCNPATANRQLLAELRSDDPAALLAALEIADISRDHAVLELLHSILSRDLSNDTELQIQLATVHALVRRGQRESLPILNRIIRKHGFLINRRLKTLQEETIRSLAHYPGGSAEKLLRELCNGKFKHLARQTLEQI